MAEVIQAGVLTANDENSIGAGEQQQQQQQQQRRCRA